MRKVYVSTVFEQPVDVVWASLGDFHRVDAWMERVHTSSPEVGEQVPTIGSVRLLTVGDDHHIARERLVSYDARNRLMTYEMAQHHLPFGMTDYLATIHVLPVTDSGRTFVEWYGEYACANAEVAPAIEAGLRDLYASFLSDLRAHLEVPVVTSPA
ncbi:SRPBCC family protein [Streptomyces sp. NPDC005799]|uniref:SRPBCC family protein n=1 Tax=Streptomyces sp. NPDC005799 TaxID=3154678 RepID=UPI0033E078BD